jgi:hypothetical protein
VGNFDPTLEAKRYVGAGVNQVKHLLARFAKMNWTGLTSLRLLSGVWVFGTASHTLTTHTQLTGHTATQANKG